MITNLIKKLKDLNINIKVVDENIAIQSPKGVVNDEIIAEIKAHKSELIEFINSYKSKQLAYSDIVPVKEQKAYPISSAQYRLWVLSQFEESNIAYNIPTKFDFTGNLDRESFQASFLKVIERHEILRTVFKEDEDGEIRQWVKSIEELNPAIQYRDYRSSKNPLSAAADYINEDSYKAFNLSEGPLLRAALLQVEDERYVFYYNMHHIISDGWSMDILARDILACYEAFKNSEEVLLPELRIQYKDYASWQQEQFSSGAYQAHEKYWTNQLSGELPVLSFPTDRSRPAIKTYNGGVVSRLLKKDLIQPFRKVLEQEGTTVFMGLLALIDTLLYRYTGQEDIIVGTPIAGRDHVDLEDQIGFYVNTLALRNQFNGEDSFRAILSKVKELTLSAYEHQVYPFDKLVEDLGLKRDMSRSPIFDVVLVLQNTNVKDVGGKEGALGGVDVTHYEGTEADHTHSKFDLTFTFTEEKEELFASVEFNSDLFEKNTIERLLRHLEQLLAELTKAPDQAVYSIDYLRPEEREDLVKYFDRTSVAYPKEETIVSLFERQVQLHPDRVALVYEDLELSYRELETQSNRLAHYLRSNYAIQADDLVGVKQDRGIEMIVCLLGVLKAGGAYVPIDPTYPEERIAFMVSDSSCKVLIDSAEYDRFLAVAEEQASSLPEQEINGNNLAYVIYTSGTTGTPKGTLIEHKNVVRLFENDENLFDFNEKDVWTLFHSYCFDFSVWEMYGALFYGGKLVIVPGLLAKEPSLYIDLLIKEGVTVLNQTPSFFYNIVNTEATRSEKELQLRYVIFGGEALSPGRLSGFHERYPSTALINMYGITETTVHVTYKEIGEEEIRRNISNIGIPIPTLSCYVLDRHQQLVPYGVSGELYVGGAGVARSYLNREELNKSRFIADPYQKGGRLYRSGDAVRLLSNGEMEYLGRVDDQVKVRGYRIELGEIESALDKQAFIVKSVVIVREDESGEKNLVAYIESKEDLDSGQLRQALGQALPEYMIPSYFVQLDSIPLTSNGKVDKRSLPSPSEQSLGSGSKYVAPRNELEEQLVAIWEEVLGREGIGVEDNFFALGGDSIKSIKIVVKIEKALNLPVGVKDLYLYPGINVLAEHLGTLKLGEGSEVTKALSSGMEEISSFRSEIEEENTSMEILPASYEDIYPLTAIERGMIYSSLLRPEEPVYYDQFNYLLEVHDRNSFVSGIANLIKRHPILRTSYYLNSFQDPAKVVLPEIDLPIEFEDISDQSKEEQRKTLENYSVADQAARYNFEGELLWKVKAYQLNEKDYFIFLSFHHAILDGWSVTIFTAELYELLSGQQDLAPLAYNYKDYCAVMLSRERSESVAAYWKNLLAGYSRTKLPFNYKGIKISEEQGMKSLFHRIDGALFDQLKTLSSEHSISFKAICLAAHTYLLHVLCAEKEVVTGMVTHDRPEFENSEKILGCFLNTVPFRINFEEISSHKSLLDKVQSYLVAVKPNEVHLSEIAHYIGEQSTLSNPIFDTLLNYTDFHSLEDLSSNTVLGEQVDASFLEGAVGSNEMTNTLFDVEADKNNFGLQLKIKYLPAYFRDEDVKTALLLYERILSAFCEDMQGEIHPGALLLEADRSAILEEFNATRVPYSKEKSMSGLFEEQVERTPEAIALRQDGEELSYRDLNRRANQLAQLLIERGIQVEDNVGLISDRSFDMIIGMYGILKAGGAYVPIDPTYPEDRQRYIIENSKVSIVICDGEVAISNSIPDVTFVQFNKEDFSIYSDKNPGISIDTRALAYTIYTSGSTGRPKGVMIAHHAAVNLIEWVNREYEIGSTDRLLFITSMCFDLSVYDIFGILAAGACVVIARQEEVQNVSRLRELMQEEKITFWDSVPTTMNYLVGELAEEDFYRQNDLRLVFLSGDWIPVALPEKIKKYFPNAKVISLGGATEGTIWSNFYPIEKVDPSWSSIPYGRPLANNFFYILDENKELVPNGVAGELYIGGVGVAEGYASDAEKTAYSFVPDPFHKDLGGRMYRTGDLGRMLPSGNMEFLGRKDHQVKIRGFRVELGEIESVISRHPLIREAIVNVFQDDNAQNQLCAYLVHKEEVPNDVLRDYLQEYLPAYMLPAYYVALEELPLTSNGKIDRKRLPLPSSDARAGVEYVAPGTEQEKELCALWEGILKVERLGLKDDVFELGANSLDVGSFINRVHKRMNLLLSIQEVFAHPTVKEIIDVLATKQGVSYAAITALEEKESYLISSAQRRLWVLSQFEEGSIAYNMPFQVELDGAYDIDLFKQAVHASIERHEVLRTVFREDENGEIRQWVLTSEELGFSIDYHDFRKEENPYQEAIDYVGRDSYQVFSLSEGPLLRAALLQVEDDRYVFYYNMHHIISDGWSMEILARDVLAHYEAYKGGQEAKLPDLRIQYKDYAAWQLEQLEGETFKAHEDYWLEQFSEEIPLFDLPVSHPRPSIKSSRGRSLSTYVKTENVARLKHYSQQQGGSLFIGLLASLNTLFYRYTSQEDFIVGTPVAGREHIDLENQIGFYVNTLALRNQVRATDSFSSLLKRVKDTTLSAYDHQVYPFDELVEKLELKRDTSRNALFDVSLTLNNQEVSSPLNMHRSVEQQADEEIKDLGVVHCKFDIEFHFTEVGDTLSFMVQYNSDVYDQEMVLGLMQHYQQLLGALLDQPELEIWALDYLKAQEKSNLIQYYDRTSVAYPKEETIVSLFERQVQLHPDRVALVYEDLELSYRELETQSNRLAHYLRSNYAIQADDLVGVKQDRGIEMIVCLLGVLKAGGAYVPIDPTYPEERIAFMVSDSSCKVLIDSAEYDRFLAVAEEQASSLPEQEINGNNLAYVIYTSGTTGTPKGTLIEHKNVVRLFENDENLFDFNEKDVWTLFHSYCFDFSVWEMYGALFYGGKLVIVPGLLAKEPSLYIDLLIKEGVTVLNQTPSFFYNIVNTEATRSEKELQLRYVIFGGEALSPGRLSGFHERYPSTALINMYGITETTVHVTYKEIGEEEIRRNISNIGIPIPTLSCYVLDRHQQLVPYGVSGELYVGGAGVARSYLNREELNKSRFIADPYQEGGRLYRSGDAVRLLSNGEMEYLGRVDDQVKVRGYRIELGEIESALDKQAFIVKSVVIVREDESGEKNLVAYIESKEDLDSGQLRQALGQALPEYMIPSYFVQLDSIPLTSNGKVDKRSLPSPSEQSLGSGSKYVAPRNELEEQLVAIWEEVLGREGIGVEDNFFDLGGNSLKAVMLITRMQRDLKVKVELKFLFQEPTIGNTAMYIDTLRWTDNSEWDLKEKEDEELII